MQARPKRYARHAFHASYPTRTHTLRMRYSHATHALLTRHAYATHTLRTRYAHTAHTLRKPPTLSTHTCNGNRVATEQATHRGKRLPLPGVIRYWQWQWEVSRRRNRVIAPKLSSPGMFACNSNKNSAANTSGINPPSPTLQSERLRLGETSPMPGAFPTPPLFQHPFGRGWLPGSSSSLHRHSWPPRAPGTPGTPRASWPRS